MRGRPHAWERVEASLDTCPCGARRRFVPSTRRSGHLAISQRREFAAPGSSEWTRSPVPCTRELHPITLDNRRRIAAKQSRSKA